MDWHRPTVEDTDGAGIGAVLKRLHRELGGVPLAGTRLVTGARGMLAATREIEAAALAAGPEAELRAGFQRAARFEEEATRYAGLAAEGVRVTAYGLGMPAPVAGVRWVALTEDRTDLANQWFVVLRGPEPVAMAGWETTPGPHGLGATSDPGRSFAGFTTGDPRVVEAMIAHLDALDDAPAVPISTPAIDPRDDLPALLSGELHPARAAELRELLDEDDRLRRDLAEVAWVVGLLRDTARHELPDVSELPPLVLPGVTPAPAGARLVLVATDDGSDPAYAGTRAAGLALARDGGGRLVLYDRSPELYLLDPYDGDGLMDEAAAAGCGRDYLAGQLREAAAAGISASAWVARGSGAAALADCAAAVPGAEVLLPAKLARPGLLDRVRGNTAGALSAGVPARVRLADERGRVMPLMPA
jgi:hypothetical protein